MPELSRFLGIIIRMFMEPSTQHHKPHIHVYYQESVAVYSFNPIELIGGSLPKKQQRLVEAWIELHQNEILEDWNLLQSGQNPNKIKPLS